MNESKSNVPNMYQTIPAVAALNRVPGFEPMKLLRPAKSRKSDEKVLKLALPYKKLWFRLAHPKGRIMVNRLKITEQMAVYEAQVYLDRCDVVPVSNFTASCERDDAVKNDYIKEAQEEAINEALSLAGFGLQFADVEMTKEAEHFGSEIPLSALPKEAPIQETNVVTPVVEQSKNLMKVTEAVENKLPVEAEENKLLVSPVMKNQAISEQNEDDLPIAPDEKTAVEEEKLPVEPAEQSLQQERKPDMTVEKMQSVQPTQQTQTNDSEEKLSAAQRAMQILKGGRNSGSIDSVTPASEVKSEEVKEAEIPKYTKSTPVPEILKLMTFEEAQKVVVDVGTCNGKTIQEVANTRPAVLKYYQFGGYKGGNNILIAAATMMYNHLESQKMEKAG